MVRYRLLNWRPGKGRLAAERMFTFRMAADA